MEIKEIINVIKTEFKKSKLSSILNKGESYLIEDYVQFIATCPMALPFAENYKFANKEFNKEYYDLFDSVEAWKNLKGKGYKKFLQVADDDIIVDEKITFGIDVCVTDNSINYHILTHEFEDPFFKEYPLYFGNEKELKFILGTVFDNLSLMESKTSARKSIKESKNTEIKVYLDGHTKPSSEYQQYDFAPYSKKYEIDGVTEFKDEVTLTFERGKAKSFTFLGITVDFDKEGNAKCDEWECEIDVDEVQEYLITFSLRLFV